MSRNKKTLDNIKMQTYTHIGILTCSFKMTGCGQLKERVYYDTQPLVILYVFQLFPLVSRVLINTCEYIYHFIKNDFEYYQEIDVYVHYISICLH